MKIVMKLMITWQRRRVLKEIGIVTIAMTVVMKGMVIVFVLMSIPMAFFALAIRIP
jgi:hypothetical protein